LDGFSHTDSHTEKGTVERLNYRCLQLRESELQGGWIRSEYALMVIFNIRRVCGDLNNENSTLVHFVFHDISIFIHTGRQAANHVKHLTRLSNTFMKFKNVNSRDIFTFLSIVFIAIIIFYNYIVPEVCGVYHDDAIYVATAKAIAEGDGYRLINLPDSPKQTKYPILYPLFLSAIWKIFPSFPHNVFIFKIATSIVASLGFGFFYIYLIRFNYCPRYTAFLSCILCLTAPQILYFSTNTLSEMPFFFLIVISLFILENTAEKDSISRRELFLLGVFISFVFLCRSAGLVIIFSGALYLYRKKHVLPKWLLLGSTLMILPWLLWVYKAIGVIDRTSMRSYYTDYFSWMIDFGLRAPLNIISTNAIFSFWSSTAYLCSGISKVFNGDSNWLLNAIFIFTGAILWFAIFIPKGRSASPRLFLSFYFLLICAWPWLPGRFLVPIMPFLVVFFFTGMEIVMEKFFPSNFARLSITIVFSVLIILNSFKVLDEIKIQQATNYPYLGSSKTVKWKSFENIFNWIKQNTDQSDIVAYGLDTMNYLYTGRSGFRPFLSRPSSLFYGDKYPATGTIEDLWSILNYYNPKYLVLSPMPGFAEEKPFHALVENFSKKYPDWIILAYLDEDIRFRIYEINYGIKDPPLSITQCNK
jgi:hypothetical protein